jgi:DNA-binding FadR family transcriptional regulator
MTVELVHLKESAANRVRRHIVAALATRRYAPGAKLPTERALAAELDAPRNAVREALAVLETEGRIVRAVGSGTFVRGDEKPASGADEKSSEVGVLQDASPKEIMEARFVLEPRLALLASSNATAADFRRLEDLLRQGDAASTFVEFDSADDAFHQAVAEATHSRLVVELYAAIGAARRRVGWGGLRRRFLTVGRRAVSCREHRVIFEALVSRDADRAEEAIVSHLRAVSAVLLEGRYVAD